MKPSGGLLSRELGLSANTKEESRALAHLRPVRVRQTDFVCALSEVLLATSISWGMMLPGHS